MFKGIISENKIPPNFLNSILTNPSLYSMFKNEFEDNWEYFQGIEKEEYLREMLRFIEDTLFSSNVFNIYEETIDIDDVSSGKLSFIRNFYDDFLLEAFKEQPENILKTKIFRGLEFARIWDKYAKNTKEFNELYDYIFNISIDYAGIIEVLTKDIISKIANCNELSMKEFDLLCNYVKNNIDGFVDMSIVMGMLHNHAYKTNHIFDTEVVETLVKSTVKSYLKEYNIEVTIEFSGCLESGSASEHIFDEKTIRIDYSLIEEFISLNYVELFERAFFEAELVKNYVLLSENRLDYGTLKLIMHLVSIKVDVDRLFVDSDYYNHEYYTDILSSNFIKTLRFFSLFGVNLIDNYVTKKTVSIEDDSSEDLFSIKEVSLDQRFLVAFKNDKNRDKIVSRFNIVKIFFNSDGTRKKARDILKNLNDERLKDVTIEYLHSRVIEPENMIDDVIGLSSYKTKDKSINATIEQELKYIFVDTFYYSLESYIKLNRGKIDVEEYLDDLAFKVNCIKDTPLTHKFIDEAIFTISDAKQNI